MFFQFSFYAFFWLLPYLWRIKIQKWSWHDKSHYKGADLNILHKFNSNIKECSTQKRKVVKQESIDCILIQSNESWTEFEIKSICNHNRQHGNIISPQRCCPETSALSDETERAIETVWLQWAIAKFTFTFLTWLVEKRPHDSFNEREYTVSVPELDLPPPPEQEESFLLTPLRLASEKVWPASVYPEAETHRCRHSRWNRHRQCRNQMMKSR